MAEKKSEWYKSLGREIGKNSGKFVSNKVFGDGHSTPYRVKIQREKSKEQVKIKELEQEAELGRINLERKKLKQIEKKELEEKNSNKLQDLIDRAVLDGELSSKEKIAIFQVAIELNLSFEEIQTVLQSEIYKINNTKFSDLEEFIDNINYLNVKINILKLKKQDTKLAVKVCERERKALIISLTNPKSKEEVFKFLDFASREIKDKSFSNIIKGKFSNKLSKLWFNKIEEIKSEAILDFEYDSKELSKINRLVDKASDTLGNNLKKSRNIIITASISIFLTIIFIIISSVNSVNKSQQEKIVLNNQITSIKQSLKTNSYIDAKNTISKIYENKADSYPNLILILKNKFKNAIESKNNDISTKVESLNESILGDDAMRLKCQFQFIKLNNKLIELEKLLDKRRYTSVKRGLQKLVWKKVFYDNVRGEEYEESICDKFIDSKRSINMQLPQKYRTSINHPFSIFK